MTIFSYWREIIIGLCAMCLAGTILYIKTLNLDIDKLNHEIAEQAEMIDDQAKGWTLDQLALDSSRQHLLQCQEQIAKAVEYKDKVLSAREKRKGGKHVEAIKDYRDIYNKFIAD